MLGFLGKKNKKSYLLTTPSLQELEILTKSYEREKSMSEPRVESMYGGPLAPLMSQSRKTNNGMVLF